MCKVPANQSVATCYGQKIVQCHTTSTDLLIDKAKYYTEPAEGYPSRIGEKQLKKASEDIKGSSTDTKCSSTLLEKINPIIAKYVAAV